MRLQFAFVQTKPNLTPLPLRSSSSSQNTGQWQDLHTSDLSIAPFSKFISTTMSFLFSARSSESISEQSFRAETLAFDFSSSSHFTWSNHDPLSNCASVVFLCSQTLFVVFLCFFRFRVLVQGLSDFRFIGFIFRRSFEDCPECGELRCHAIDRGCQSLFVRNLWRETEKAHFRRVKKHFLIFFSPKLKFRTYSCQKLKKHQNRAMY